MQESCQNIVQLHFNNHLYRENYTGGITIADGRLNFRVGPRRVYNSSHFQASVLAEELLHACAQHKLQGCGWTGLPFAIALSLSSAHVPALLG